MTLSGRTSTRTVFRKSTIFHFFEMFPLARFLLPNDPEEEQNRRVGMARGGVTAGSLHGGVLEALQECGVPPSGRPVARDPGDEGRGGDRGWGGGEGGEGGIREGGLGVPSLGFAYRWQDYMTYGGVFMVRVSGLGKDGL